MKTFQRKYENFAKSALKVFWTITWAICCPVLDAQNGESKKWSSCPWQNLMRNKVSFNFLSFEYDRPRVFISLDLGPRLVATCNELVQSFSTLSKVKQV